MDRVCESKDLVSKAAHMTGSVPRYRLRESSARIAASVLSTPPPLSAATRPRPRRGPPSPAGPGGATRPVRRGRPGWSRSSPHRAQEGRARSLENWPFPVRRGSAFPGPRPRPASGPPCAAPGSFPRRPGRPAALSGAVRRSCRPRQHRPPPKPDPSIAGGTKARSNRGASRFPPGAPRAAAR